MWRLSGIFRDVELRALPTRHIRDFFVRPSLDKSHREGSLALEAWLEGAKDASLAVYLQGHQFSEASRVAEVPFVEGLASIEVPLGEVATWSDELPNLYRLVLVATAAGGKVLDVVASDIGFRRVEIRGG